MILQKLTAIKHKKIWGSLILVSLLSIVYINFQANRALSRPSSLFPPSASSSPSPKLSLKLTNTYPPAGPTIITMPYLAFVFTFNQALTLSDFKVTVSPQIDLQLSLSPDGFSLYASPTKPWQYKQEYTVILFGPGNTQITQQKTIFLDPAQYPPEDFDEKISL